MCVLVVRVLLVLVLIVRVLLVRVLQVLVLLVCVLLVRVLLVLVSLVRVLVVQSAKHSMPLLGSTLTSGLTLAGEQKIARVYKQNFTGRHTTRDNLMRGYARVGRSTLPGVFTREKVNPTARVTLARRYGNPPIRVTLAAL